MERWHRTESTESGWISLADLLILLFAIAMVMGIGALSIASRERAKAEDANTRMEAAESRINGLAAQELMFEQIRGDLGDWQFVAREVEGRWRGTPDGEGVPVGTAYEFGAFLENHRGRWAAELSESRDANRRLETDARNAAAALGSALSPGVASPNSLQSVAASAARELQEARSENQRLEEYLERESGARMAAEAALARAMSKARDLRQELAGERTLAVANEREAASVLAARDQLKSQLQDSRENAQKQLRDIEEKQRGINQQLLGITGSFEDVIFVIDRSQSMNKDGRWDAARRTIRAWIEHLPVKRAAMVVFGSSVTAIPDTTSLVAMEGALRQQFVSQLDQIKPSGSTLTLKALQRAMRFETPDAIILFTDGNPERASGDRSSADQREAIVRLVEEYHLQHPQTRVHTVGIGDYFNPRMSEFLLTLAERTGGTFIGR